MLPYIFFGSGDALLVCSSWSLALSIRTLIVSPVGQSFFLTRVRPRCPCSVNALFQISRCFKRDLSWLIERACCLRRVWFGRAGRMWSGTEGGWMSRHFFDETGRIGAHSDDLGRSRTITDDLRRSKMASSARSSGWGVVRCRPVASRQIRANERGFGQGKAPIGDMTGWVVLRQPRSQEGGGSLRLVVLVCVQREA